MEVEFVDGRNEIYKRDMIRNLHKFLSESLSDREVSIIKHYFFNVEKTTPRSIGKRYGVTASRFHQLKQRALNKLKKHRVFDKLNKLNREIYYNYMGIK